MYRYSHRVPIISLNVPFRERAAKNAKFFASMEYSQDIATRTICNPSINQASRPKISANMARYLSDSAVLAELLSLVVPAFGLTTSTNNPIIFLISAWIHFFFPRQIDLPCYSYWFSIFVLTDRFYNSDVGNKNSKIRIQAWSGLMPCRIFSFMVVFVQDICKSLN